MTDIAGSDGNRFPDAIGPQLTHGRHGPNHHSGAANSVARWCTLILDGRHAWGTIDISPRHGVTRYRLVVFPPGIDSFERRLLRAWRGWPTWGALLWLAGQIVLSAFLTPAVTFGVATAAYLGVGGVLFALVAEARSRVRTMTVVRIAGYPDERAAMLFGELKTQIAALCLADVQREQGLFSPAEHEAVCWRVYDRLGRSDLGPVAR